MLFLYHLPDDILYLVLSYLDCRALNSLAQVCKKMYNFTSRDVVWKKIAKECINSGITQQGRDIFPKIPLKDRVKISQNWRRGHCRKEAVLKWKNNLLPWIQLDSDVMYLSQAADIRAYQLRPDSGGLQRKPVAVYSGHWEDVCRFIVTESHLISAGVDGKIILHQKQGSFSMEYSAHNQEVNCIDSKGGVIVSGSRDRTARVWSLSSNRLGECLHTIPTLDRVWSLAISPSQRIFCGNLISLMAFKVHCCCNKFLSSFVTGTACCGHVAPLRIWDMERNRGGQGQPLCPFHEGCILTAERLEFTSQLVPGRQSISPQVFTSKLFDIRGCDTSDSLNQFTGKRRPCQTSQHPYIMFPHKCCQLLTCLGTDFLRGAGVLDIVYESPSTLLSCGYDTYIRYWDVRASTRKCVMEWEEPHDSALYCIQSDSNHMIASGSSYYGVVRLWDKRQTRCLQTFSLSSPTSSPVYCLRFNSTHLYAALASALYALDFKGLDSRGRK
ncbi:FBXW4 protein, partial [Polyodon spathula]|nr:FBXW4 protein [Polyodon spathula]